MKFMNKVYIAQCSDCGGTCIISIHKSLEGAEEALERDKIKTKVEHDDLYKDEESAFAWDFDLTWNVRETELLD